MCKRITNKYNRLYCFQFVQQIDEKKGQTNMEKVLYQIVVINIAVQYGIEIAIIFSYFTYFIDKHCDDDGFDVEKGVFMPAKRIVEYLPFFKERRVYYYLKEMEDLKLFKRVRNGDNPWDQTYWYTYGEVGWSMLENYYPKQFQNIAKANAKKDKCTIAKKGNCTSEENNKCTSTNSDNSIYINKDKKYVDRINKEKKNKEIYSNIIQHFNLKCDKSYKLDSDVFIAYVDALLVKGFSEQDIISVIDQKCKEWTNTKYAQYLRPSTLFGDKFEIYLNDCQKSSGNYKRKGNVI